MLKKLIKYDLKDLFSISWIFYIIVILLSFILFIYNYNEWFGKSIILELSYSLLNTILLILLILLFGFIVFKILKRFSKNVYSDEGYLTNTLPINKGKLYFSKILSSTIYLITSGLIISLAYSFGMAFVFTKSTCFDGLNHTCRSSQIESLIEEWSSLLHISPIWVLLLLLLLIFFEVMVIILAGYNGIIKNHLTNTPRKIKSVIYSICFYLMSVLVIVFIFYIASKINPDIAKLFTMKEKLFYEVMYQYTETYKQITLIGIFSYLGINICLLFNGYRLFNKGINLE